MERAIRGRTNGFYGRRKEELLVYGRWSVQFEDEQMASMEEGKGGSSMDDNCFYNYAFHEETIIYFGIYYHISYNIMFHTSHVLG
jgi:hypothetical protein